MAPKGGSSKGDDGAAWCYYCDRSFQSDRILFDHQRLKHFACGSCHKRFTSSSSMRTHTWSVHGVRVEAIANALPGREDPSLDVSGMAGVPVEALQAHMDAVKSTASPASKDSESGSGKKGSGKRQPDQATSSSKRVKADMPIIIPTAVPHPQVLMNPYASSPTAYGAGGTAGMGMVPPYRPYYSGPAVPSVPSPSLPKATTGPSTASPALSATISAPPTLTAFPASGGGSISGGVTASMPPVAYGSVPTSVRLAPPSTAPYPHSAAPTYPPPPGSHPPHHQMMGPPQSGAYPYTGGYGSRPPYPYPTPQQYPPYSGPPPAAGPYGSRPSPYYGSSVPPPSPYGMPMYPHPSHHLPPAANYYPHHRPSYPPPMPASAISRSPSSAPASPVPTPPPAGEEEAGKEGPKVGVENVETSEGLLAQ